MTKQSNSKKTIDRRGRSLLNRLDRFVDTAREVSSRGAAFIYALIGILAQIAHNSLLAYDVSLFENEYLRIAQAVVVALAVSFALMYFVLTADGKPMSDSTQKIQTFFVLEVFLNGIYYLKKIVFDNLYEQVSDIGSWIGIDWLQPNWFMLLIGLPFAYFIPFIIKSYAGSIQAHKPALAIDDDDFVKNSAITEEFDFLKKQYAELSDKVLNADKSNFEESLVEFKNEILESNSAINDEVAERLQIINTNFEEHGQMIDQSRILIKTLSEIEMPDTATISELQKLVDDYKSKVDTVVKLIRENDQSERIDDLKKEIETTRNSVSKKLSEVSTEGLIKTGDKIRIKNGEKQSDFTISKQ